MPFTSERGQPLYNSKITSELAVPKVIPQKLKQLLYSTVSIVTDHCDTKSTKCGENLSAGSTGGC